MSDTWFRGEAAGGPVSQRGTAIHDLGEGTYLTSRYDVAKQYADLRAPNQLNKQVILTTNIDPATLGKVLDLRTDARWSAFVNGYGGAALNAIKSGTANQNYGITFNNFLATYKIDRNQYDAIIGPEYVRGGDQLCIVHKNGQPTPLVGQIRATFKVVSSGPIGVTPPTVPNSTVGGPDLSGKLKGVGGRMMRNQSAAAAIGMALGGAIQGAGDKGIQWTIEDELDKYTTAIDSILNRGEGVLIIIHMHQWEIADNNGMRARQYNGLSLSGGTSQDDALLKWRSYPRVQPLVKGWRYFENYGWIPPGS